MADSNAGSATTGRVGSGGSSRTFFKVDDTTYRAGFIDNSSLHTLKMAIDFELNSLSTAIFKLTERITILNDEVKKINDLLAKHSIT